MLIDDEIVEKPVLFVSVGLIIFLLLFGLILCDILPTIRGENENLTEVNPDFYNIDIDGNHYIYTNCNDTFNVSSDNIELKNLIVNNSEYGYITYDNTVIIHMNDRWYQFVME